MFLIGSTTRHASYMNHTIELCSLNCYINIKYDEKSVLIVRRYLIYHNQTVLQHSW